ncbi:hypothetical protein GALMADRAFT_649948 [Galerina marginata CBS 339.88]|uniref:C2 domain-containing protein n=1 Tax=Galerina marginata (strain CBS 339.88) TaxID=685588 RepID=A0A067TUF2_GALM3|nr:hypothetical protein GALMADRAFT_649948 [Galerina marginata CBS 339.88]
MSSTPREIGTLIVVVLRANHLPNKRHIGKQDPYCLVVVNGEKRRTKAIKRGGQHPEWDEEVRFTLFEDVDDVLARTAHGDGTPPPPPPKDDKKNKKIKGGKTMKVACYADDPREPELIGETEVDLTEVLTKGETDEWFTLNSKDKFAGKVYLELTFWSNEPPPEKKVSQKPPKNNKQYGGPGSFVPSGDAYASSPASIRTTSGVYDNHSRQNSDVIPSSLRASSSAANLDLYVPPYERNRNPQLDHLAQEFSEFGVSAQPRRRESFPPVPGSYSQTAGIGHSTLTHFPAYGYEQSISEVASVYSYDPPNGQASAHQYQASTGTLHGYPSQTYQPAYEMTSPSTYHPPARGPRHSVPTASSGFMPIPQSSVFGPPSTHVSEPSGFAPPLSHTPAPMGYNSQFHSSPQAHSTSLSFHPQQSFPTSQAYSYPTYGIPTSTSAPPQQFISSPPITVPQANSAPPQLYPMSPTHETPSAPTPVPHMNGQSDWTNGQSRPLPQQPQVVYTHQQPIQQQPVQQPSQTITSSHSLPPPGGAPQPLGSYSPTQVGNVYPATNGYPSVPPPPPPPPPPPHQYNTGPTSVSTTGNHLPVPPPPPPPNLNAARRRASLPQPPVTFQQQSALPQPPPPPPPPPSEYYVHNPLPPPPPPPLNSTLNSHHTTYQPGPPPKPPPVDEYGQWTQPVLSVGQQISRAY